MVVLYRLTGQPIRKHRLSRNVGKTTILRCLNPRRAQDKITGEAIHIHRGVACICTFFRDVVGDFVSP